MATDTLEVFGVEYTGVAGFKATDDNGNTKTYIRPDGNLSLSANGSNIDCSQYATVSVAVPSPAAGTEGTPVATKGTVSNNSVDVTPSVTNTAGLIQGGTHTGTAVTVTASELVSGTKSINSSGLTDVGNYRYANVPSAFVSAPSSVASVSATLSAGTNKLTMYASGMPAIVRVTGAGFISEDVEGTTSATLSTSVPTQAAQTITPGTTDQTIASGTYLTGTQTISGDANLVAGNIKNGTTIFGVTGTYSGGTSGKNVQVAEGCYRATSSTYTDCGMEITVAKAGTYNILWAGYRSSTSGTSGCQVYKNGSALGSAQTTFDGTWTNVQKGHLASQTLAANDKITIRARSRGNNYYMYVWNLTIQEV